MRKNARAPQNDKNAEAPHNDKKRTSGMIQLVGTHPQTGPHSKFVFFALWHFCIGAFFLPMTKMPKMTI